MYKMGDNYTRTIEFGEIQWKTSSAKALLTSLIIAFALFANTLTAQTPSIPGTGTSAAICGTCAPVGWQDIGGTPDISDRNTAGGGNTLGAGATWVNAPLPLPPTGDVRWITMRDVGDFNTQADESVTSTITGLLAGKLYELRIYVMSSFTNADGGTGNNEYYGGSHVDSFGYQIGSNPRVDININNAIYQDQWREITIIFVASNGTAQSPGTETITVFPNDDAITNGSAQNFEIIHFAVDDVNAIEILDTDGDGIDDFVDIDDDNDGILDINEYGISTNPNLDDDSDGIPNYLDLDFTGGVDSNNDGIPDNSDFDLDGVPNHLDLDSDNDGILDNVEAQTTAGYIAPSGTGTGITDIDMDGLDDNYDSDTASVTTTDSVGLTAVNSDTDASGLTLPDYLDIDSDNDGIPDNVEAQGTLTYIASPYTSTTDVGEVGDNGVYSVYENVDTYAAVGLTPVDTDLDNTPDYRDADSDNDGTTDINESGRGNVLSGNDADGDGLDDNLDTQSGPDPNDNISDPATDLQENPLDDDVNTGGDLDYRDGITGIDSDEDGIPDTVDIDDDNDGILDINEGACSGGSLTTTVRQLGAGPIDDTQNVDLTSLGVSIGDEVTISNLLADGDLSAGNTAEVFSLSINGGTAITSLTSNVQCAGALTAVSTLVNQRVTVIDIGSGTPGISLRVQYAADVNAICSGNTIGLEYTVDVSCERDTDGDGVVDSLDIDSDNDGITDTYEATPTGSYIAPTGLDDDNDGLDNAYDSNDSDTSTGASLGIINFSNVDGDALPDYLDIDSDGDGIPDNVEAQSTLGYVAPNGVPGANGLDSAYDFTDAYTSTGLSTTLINTDNDAEPDYRDTDADADGTPDIQENGDTDNTASGTDTDGDGLDDNFDDVFGLDVNDDNDNPATTLGDADADVNSLGDVDYRDNLAGTDTDGDGVVDTVDIDDDNDGILDVNEGFCASTTIANENFETTTWTTTGTTATTGTFVLINPVATTYQPGEDASSTNALAFITGQNTGGADGTDDVDAGAAVALSPTYAITDASTFSLMYFFGQRDAGDDATGDFFTIETSINGGTDWTEILRIGDVASSPVWTNITGSIPAGASFRIRVTASDGATEGDIIEAGIDDLFIEEDCSTDTDGDGIPNYLDQDSDGDGILDVVEAQSTAGYTAPTGMDSDGDGLDNAYDDTPNGNSDGTGSNGITPAELINTDGDAVPDYLDIDADNDGIPDNVEAQTTKGYTAPSGNVGTNGIDASYENNDTFTATGLDPNNFDSTDEPDYRDTDSDNDGTNDDSESGITDNGGGTADADGDGLLDRWEGSDATAGEAYDVNDEINDPVNNLLDEDNDGNSTGDVDYRDTQTVPDTDGDGILDDVDLDDDNDGILDTVEDAAADGDADGIPNRLDIDSDNDGIPDNVEAQSTSGYIAPSGIGAGITDVNMDGVDDNYAGGLTPVNTDNVSGNNSDANPDYLDTDSDGDGTLDINENGNANSTSGTDTDGDGLDDAFEGLNNNDGFDVNDQIGNPITDLPDDDGDVNGAGDVDYRDHIDDAPTPAITGNTLWLRADIGVIGGSTVTSWEDQTASNADFSGSGGTTPDATVNLLNFNPTVTFTPGNDDVLTYIGNLNPRTMYIVYNDTSTAGFTTPFTSNDGNGIGHGFDNDTQIYSATFTPTDVLNGEEFISGLSADFTSVPRPDSFQLHSRIFTSNLSNETLTYYVGNDRTNTGRTINGSVAEIMLFSDAHTAVERQKIESYLAIKYGFTLDQTGNDGTIEEGDYVIEGATNGTGDDFIVWDESANSAYHNDVAGIGRDDSKDFTQKQSSSVNSSSIVTIGVGTIAANNASNGNSINSNNSFLMWGHNGVTVNNTNTSSVTLLCESELQLDRVWKIVETGSMGTVEVAVPQLTIDAALTSPSTHVTLLKVADDANFTTNVKHIPVTEREIFGDGTQYYTANFDFNGTKYFTFTEVLGIFWNGDTATWTGGAGGSNAPSTNTDDNLKVLVIDSETSQTNAIMTENANIECVWVKPNSKLVVGNDLFIEFNEDFVLEGEIRLIGDGQLIQTHTGLSNVQGNGVIYRDQASNTPSVYRYNYWSSPVVAALGNTSYTTSAVMFDGTTPTSENSTTKAINWQDYNGAVSSLNSAPTDPITIATWWIYSYFNGVDRGDWQHKFSDQGINIGEGFIMKSTGRAPQNFTFMGSPNDGTITKVLTPNTTSLLGNPYPSTIDTQLFISDNDDVIDGTLYFWEHQGETSTTTAVEGHTEFGYIGGYSQRNSAMGVAANSVTSQTAGLGDGTYTEPPRYIAVGQGFFVSVPGTKGGTLRFENTQRTDFVDGTGATEDIFDNTFFRTNDNQENQELPNFKIGMDYVNGTNAEIHRQLGINFKEGNTFAYESGFDSSTFDLQENDMYWDFEDIDQNLVIAGVGAISSELQVPLGFVMDIGQTVTISIDEKDNMDGYTIYLVDLVTGRFFDMDNPIELNLPKGSYSGRFIITFAGTALSNNDNPLLQEFSVFMDNTAREIVIKNNNNTSIKSVELYNILGQNVKQWKDISTSNLERLEVNQPAGVYIVKVNTENGKITKKIVLE